MVDWSNDLQNFKIYKDFPNLQISTKQLINGKKAIFMQITPMCDVANQLTRFLQWTVKQKKFSVQTPTSEVDIQCKRDQLIILNLIGSKIWKDLNWFEEWWGLDLGNFYFLAERVFDWILRLLPTQSRQYISFVLLCVIVHYFLCLYSKNGEFILFVVWKNLFLKYLEICD